MHLPIILLHFCFLFSTSEASDCSCGWRNKPAARNFGGNETGINEFPMMAELVFKGSGLLLCGGTIISQHYTVTAAHCFPKMDPYNYHLLVGEHDVQHEGESDAIFQYDISEIIINPYYNNYEHDIALVRVHGQFVFDGKIGPACLPNSDLYIGGQPVEILGWGSKTLNSVLMKIDSNVVDNADCKRVWYPHKIQENMMCTYGNGQTTCGGDSGGPVLWTDPQSGRLTVVGVVSRGRTCEYQNFNEFPVIHARVSSHLDWIAQTTGEQLCFG